MNKKEALNYIRKKRGFIPYVTIFEIYSDDDEIPKEFIDMSCEEIKPNGNFIICSPQLADILKT